MGRRQTYNVRNGRYFDASGLVDEQLIQDTMQARIDAAQLRMEEYTAALASGDFTIQDFQRAMDEEIINLNTQLYALGRGGWESMTPADYERVSVVVNSERGYLDGFLNDLRTPTMTEAQLEARMKLYADHSWQAYWEGRTIAMQRAGLVEERRVLNPAEHCDDCLNYAAQGWQPIGTLPKPGQQSQCKAKCKCSMEYR